VAVPAGAAEPCARPAVRSGRGRLTVTSVVKSFKSAPSSAASALNFPAARRVGLLGPNGAGKTTVFYMITGLIPADEGSIKIDGRDVTKLPMYRGRGLASAICPRRPRSSGG